MQAGELKYTGSGKKKIIIREKKTIKTEFDGTKQEIIGRPQPWFDSTSWCVFILTERYFLVQGYYGILKCQGHMQC